MGEGMRRSDKDISEHAVDLIREVPYGVLSTVGEDGAPYGVPISFVYSDGALFFHSALEGRKLENIKGDSRVSFCAVAYAEVNSEHFTADFRSVIAKGTIKELNGDCKKGILELFLQKYSSHYLETGMKYLKNVGHLTRVFRLEIDQMTAKGKM